MTNPDGFLANAMPYLLGAAYFALMAYVIGAAP